MPRTARTRSWQGTDSTDLEIATPDGMSAHGGKLYLSYSKANAIKVLDERHGREEKSLSVPTPSSLKVVSPTNAFVISGGKQLLSVDPSTGTVKPLVAGLADAHGLAVATDGTIYVGDNGPDHQVKVFAADGKPLAPIGRNGRPCRDWPLGGPNAGLHRRPGHRRQRPTVDRRKRVDAQASQHLGSGHGKLLARVLRPFELRRPGGAIDPADPNVMVGQGCEWRLDPQTGRAKCTGVITHDGMEVSRFASGPDGRVYLAVAGNWAFNVGPLKIYERMGDADYRLRTVIFYADETGKELPIAGHGQASNAKQTMVWSDANGDGQRQPGEISGAAGRNAVQRLVHGTHARPDAVQRRQAIQADRLQRPAAHRSTTWPNRPKCRPPDSVRPTAGWCCRSANTESITAGSTATTSQSGKLAWRYPDTFVGVHGSHNAPPAETGLIRGSFPLCGTVKLPNPLGNVWAIRDQCRRVASAHRARLLSDAVVPARSAADSMARAGHAGRHLGQRAAGHGGRGFRRLDHAGQ